ncbi:MAG: hypothetical protein HY369_00565 [Candidatus Aenigmarchaeota archaeon]|nr:hypothetical protein [Candidatus Aenigmarchaeota archaeon]
MATKRIPIQVAKDIAEKYAQNPGRCADAGVCLEGEIKEVRAAVSRECGEAAQTPSSHERSGSQQHDTQRQRIEQLARPVVKRPPPSQLIDHLYEELRAIAAQHSTPEGEARHREILKRLRAFETKDARRLRQQLATSGPLKLGEVDAALSEARETIARYEHTAPTDPSGLPRSSPPAHEKGGLLLTLPPGYHPKLAYVIEEARSRIREGIDPMDVGDYIAGMIMGADTDEFAMCDLKVTIAYLLKAMESKGRQDVIRDRNAVGLGYASLDLINDHNGQRENHLIGIVVAPNEVPRIVACYRPGQKGPVCLNEIEKPTALSASTWPHLVRPTTIFLESDQLATLHETGRLRYGDAWIRLMPATTGERKAAKEGGEASETKPVPEPSPVLAAEFYRRWIMIRKETSKQKGPDGRPLLSSPQLTEAAKAWYAAMDVFVLGSPAWVELQDLIRAIDSAAERGNLRRRP